MTTYDAQTQNAIDDTVELIDAQVNGVVQKQVDEALEFVAKERTETYRRITTAIKDMRDDLIDELNEEVEYSHEDIAQYIDSTINDTLAIVSDHLPLAEEDRPLTDFYFEIINT